MKRSATLLALALWMGAGCVPAADTVVFGAAISITGKTAKEGGYTLDGYQVAIDKINEMGGIKVGGKTYKVELKYYDDETKPERTAQLIEKLINEDKVNLILGPYGSSPTGTAAPICERYKIPMVEANGSAESIFSKGYKYTFMILSPARLYLRGVIDAVRAKDSKPLKFVFQTSINAPRQKTQAIVKQAAAKAGIEMELKSVVASSFYSSNPANPDTYTHFYADLQLITYLMGPPDPERLMRVFTSWEVAQKENNWQKFNVWRWRSEEYDRLYRAAETEMDPVKRAALFIRMNDLVVQNGVVIPIVLLAKAAAISNRLRGIEHNPFELDFWNLPFWSREG